MRLRSLLLASTVAALLARPVAAGVEDQLERVTKYYQRLERFVVSMRIELHPDGHGSTPQRLKATCRRKGARYLQEFGHLLVLSTPQARLVVDRSARTIFVNDREEASGENPVLAWHPGEAMERARQAGHQVRDLSDMQGLALQVSGGKPGQPTVLLRFEREAPRLKQMILSGGAGSGIGRIVVDYVWLEPDSADESQLDPSYYISRRGKTLTAARNFVGYRVVRGNAP